MSKSNGNKILDNQGGTSTKTRSHLRLSPPVLWKVILHNDDFTTQEFVVWVLQSVFRKDEAEAVRIMLEVHRKGRGVAGIYPYDVADTKAAQVKAMAEAKEFPLLCTVEPEA
jgi:ATP-dependent Clp protease adaptor protein ClpS